MGIKVFFFIYKYQFLAIEGVPQHSANIFLRNMLVCWMVVHMHFYTYPAIARVEQGRDILHLNSNQGLVNILT